eukprot:TRINITY_DN65769_c0_g1_i1.p1 TRINITY_DN65769_c0_g1~~TRINITY_DN65769_c0_g1_i1.p1  ORF type:complete len:478 (+),score=126.46 TRINITY_DN65769_c0_g1_i1:132-1436(+)
MGDPEITEVTSERGLRCREIDGDAFQVPGLEEQVKLSDVLKRNGIPVRRGPAGPQGRRHTPASGARVESAPFRPLLPLAVVTALLWLAALIAHPLPPCRARLEPTAAYTPPDHYFLPQVWAEFGATPQEGLLQAVADQLSGERKRLRRAERFRRGAADPANNGTACPVSWLHSAQALGAEGSPFQCPVLGPAHGAHSLDEPEQRAAPAARARPCVATPDAVAGWLRRNALAAKVSGAAWVASSVLLAALLTRACSVLAPFSPFLLGGVALSAGCAVASVGCAWLGGEGFAAVAEGLEVDGDAVLHLQASDWPGAFLKGPVAAAAAPAARDAAYGAALCIRQGCAAAALLLLAQLPQEGLRRSVMETWRNLLSLPAVVLAVALLWRPALLQLTLWAVTAVSIAPLAHFCHGFSYMRAVPPDASGKDVIEGLASFL